MSPGIVFIADPRPHRARRGVEFALDKLKAADDRRVTAACGCGWAAAAIAPPVNERTCGAEVYTDGQDILIWAGEMFLPDAWPIGVDAPMPQQAISAAVLRQLRRSGLNVLAEIDGAFCGAWYDFRRHRWAIFNDRWGLLPVFYWAQGDSLVVSPKAWLTWQAAGVPLKLSDLGVADVLRTQNTLDDHTLIDGVHWLEPAGAVFWSPDGCEVRRYWDFQHRPEPVSDYDDLIDRFVDAHRRTVERLTSCASPLMLGISGGLDSRMMLAMCHAIGQVPSCFTSGPPFHDDVRFGRQLARVAGAPHQWAPLTTDGLADRLAALIVETDGLHGAGHLVMSTATRAHLAGHTGSVLLEGYMHGVLGGADLPADEGIAPDGLPHRSRWAQAFLHGGGDCEFINRLLRPDLADESYLRWQAHVDDAYHRAPVDDPLHRAEYAIITGRSGRNDVLATNLARRDALVRSPACDRLMIDWYATTPATLRRARQVYIDALCRRFPRFARVGRADGSSGLPIARNRWLREYCWQREKIYRRYASLRWSQVRRWGANSLAVRAWAFNTWRRSGALDVLTAADARVLEWVPREALLEAWQHAARDPLQAVPLMSLATIEIMVRWLQRAAAPAEAATTGNVRFRSFDRPPETASDKTALPALST